MVDWIIDQFLKKSSLYGGKVLIAKRGEIGKVYFLKNAPNLLL
jgi:hypothetical protein